MFSRRQYAKVAVVSYDTNQKLLRHGHEPAPQQQLLGGRYLALFSNRSACASLDFKSMTVTSSTAPFDMQPCSMHLIWVYCCCVLQRRAGPKGHGLYTDQDLAAGQFVIQYVGEVLEEEEYLRRKHYYIQTGQRHYYFMNIGNGEVIDACRKVRLAANTSVLVAGAPYGTAVVA